MEKDTFINWLKAINSNDKSNVIKVEKPTFNGTIITETWTQGGKLFGIKKLILG